MRIQTASLKAGVALAAFAIPVGAWAQDNSIQGAAAGTAQPGSERETNSFAGTDDEIVVTANKREERLVDVANSVTALGGDDLEYRNLRQIEDFAAQVPGFTFQPGGVRSVRLILRGLNSGGSGATAAIVVDETPLTYQSGLSNGAGDTANIDTYDLARIEVLKGPQGTLYGATAQGGLIKYVTNAPRPDRLEGGGEVQVQTIHEGGTGYLGRAFLNVPLIADKLAIRGSGFYEDVAGWIDNPLRNDEDANDGKRWAGRLSLLFTPSDALSIRITGAHQEQEFDDNGSLEIVGSPLAPANLPANRFDLIGDEPQQNSYLGNPSNNVYEFINGTVNLDIGFADLVSATSWSKLRTEFNADISFGTPAPGLTYADLFSPLYGTPIALNQVQTNAADKFNQEFRISSKPGAKLGGMGFDWQIGAFYAKEDVTFLQGFEIISRATGQELTAPLPGGSLSAPADYEEYSGFANVNLHLTEQLELAVGGRYSENNQTSQVITFFGLATGPDSTSAPIRSKESKFTYSGSLSYKFDTDTMLYARIATGYRPGGPNFVLLGSPPDLPLFYKADNTVNYELGFRTSFLGGRADIDIAAYHIDWTDIQTLTTFVSSVTGQFVTVVANAGKAKVDGFEYNLGFRITPEIRVSTVGSYTNARLAEDAPGLGGESGDQLAYVPKFQNTVNVDFESDISESVKGFGGISWTHGGSRRTGFSSSPVFPGHFRLPAYDLVNAQAGVRWGNFEAAIFARNLFNEDKVQNYSAVGGAFLTGSAQILQPRTLGVRLGVRY